MMMKILLAAGALILLAGCGNVSRTVAQVTGHSEICVNHTQYLQFPSGVVVENGPDDKPVHC